ncbi:MAG: hypothetical protein RBS56_00970 [Candidatus Gracilibacteria bacterium]|jgi:hypothetical protein|nr:hypothetical protein [Candidatus Gracilibacteria bacterium]
MNRPRFFSNGSTGALRDPSYIKKCQLSIVQGTGTHPNPFFQLEKPSFKQISDTEKEADKSIYLAITEEQTLVSELAKAQIDDSGSDFAKTSGTEYQMIDLTDTEAETIKENDEEISGMKGELFRLRDYFVQDCLRNGKNEQAGRYSEETSIFELLRCFPNIITPGHVLFENLSENLKKLFLLIGKSEYTNKIGIKEDENYPGGISLSGENEAIFWFLKLNDYFGLKISSLTIAPRSSDKEIERIVQIPGLNGLKSLDWSFNPITANGLLMLFESPIGKSLRRLCLRNTSPNDEAMKVLTSKNHLWRLTHLDLSINAFGDAIPQTEDKRKALQRLKPFHPQYMERIKAMEQSDKILHDEHLAKLFGKGVALNLVELILRLNNLSKKTCASLRTCVFPQLKKFDLGSCSLGNEGVSSLMSSGGLGNLENLILTGNAIGDDGMASIANSPNFSKLKRLDLSKNGIKKLLIFDNFPNLEFVDLSKNPIVIDLVEFIGTNKEQLKERGYKIRISESSIFYNQRDLLKESGLIGSVFEIVN